MSEKTITTIRLSDHTRQELDEIKDYYNISTVNQTIEDAIRRYRPAIQTIKEQQSEINRLKDRVHILEQRMLSIRRTFTMILNDPLNDSDTPT